MTTSDSANLDCTIPPWTQESIAERIRAEVGAWRKEQCPLLIPRWLPYLVTLRLDQTRDEVGSRGTAADLPTENRQTPHGYRWETVVLRSRCGIMLTEKKEPAAGYEIPGPAP